METHQQLARAVLSRFGGMEHIDSAFRAWRRLLGNNCTYPQFYSLVAPPKESIVNVVFQFGSVFVSYELQVIEPSYNTSKILSGFQLGEFAIRSSDAEDGSTIVVDATNKPIALVLNQLINGQLV